MIAMEQKRIEIEFHHEESGYCLAVFKGIGAYAGKWFNRMEDGTWFYSSKVKGLYENSHKVEIPCVFLIYAHGAEQPFAIDSNVPELVKTPYVSIGEVVGRLKAKYLECQDNVDYDTWAKAMCDCEEFKSYKGYKDTFLHYEVEDINDKKVDLVMWAGKQHEVIKRLYKNKVSAKEYWEYILLVRVNGGVVEEHLTVYSFTDTNLAL